MRQSALALILNERQRFLAVKHAYGPRWYSAPGGGVEPEETPQAAVIREVQEELGVGIDVEYLMGLYDVDWGKFQSLVYVFACRIVGGEPHVNQPEEIESFGWFTPDTVPKDINPLGWTLFNDLATGARGVVRTVRVNLDSQTR